MDFWLSFMAVVSTFVYLAAIDETSKRTIHTVVAILTALMAETGPTRYYIDHMPLYEKIYLLRF